MLPLLPEANTLLKEQVKKTGVLFIPHLSHPLSLKICIPFWSLLPLWSLKLGFLSNAGPKFFGSSSLNHLTLANAS
jgi:hypothetical protein